MAIGPEAPRLVVSLGIGLADGEVETIGQNLAHVGLLGRSGCQKRRGQRDPDGDLTQEPTASRCLPEDTVTA